MAEKRAVLQLLVLVLAPASLSMDLAIATTAVPAIFVFGDSILDVGNNNFLPNTSAQANFPHYGIDYPGGIPTGRFSNGNNTADFLATFMGFHQSPPAFLSVISANGLASQMFQGINFASGGAGIQDHVGDSLGGAISLRSQIENFRTVRSNMTSLNGSAATDALLSNSLFLISIGSNDLIEYAKSNDVTKNTTANEVFVASIVPLFNDHLQTLYQLGARKFGVIGVSLIGCIPFIRSFNDSGICSQELNEMAYMFHRAINTTLIDLQYALPGMNYSLGNSYDMVIDIYNRQQDYGFDVVTNACCGEGPSNGRTRCQPNVTYCSNRDGYLFWDAYHPTQYASRLGAVALYIGPSNFVEPINFSQLMLTNSAGS